MLLAVVIRSAIAAPGRDECSLLRSEAMHLLELDEDSAWGKAQDAGIRCRGILGPSTGPIARWTRQGWAAYARWDGEATMAAAERATLWALATAGPASDAVTRTASLLAHAADLEGWPHEARREVATAALGDRTEAALARGVLEELEGEEDLAASQYERALESPVEADRGLAATLLGGLQDDEALLERGLADIEERWGPDHPAVAMSLSALARHRADRGDLATAVRLHQRALEIRTRALAPDHLATAQTQVRLGQLLQNLGDLEGALPLLQQALGIRERALGPDHRKTLSVLLILGDLYEDLGRLEDAESATRRALEARERTLGPDHPDTADALDALAMIRLSRGDPDGALPLMERAVALCAGERCVDERDVVVGLCHLATVLEELGRLEEATERYEQALRLQERSFGSGTLDGAVILANLGQVARAKGDLGAAREAYRDALEILERERGPEAPGVAAILQGLAGVHQDLGDLPTALSLFSRALEILERTVGPDRPDTATAVHNLGVLYWHLGRLEEAVSSYRRALDLRVRILGWDHAATATTLDNLSAAQQARGELAEASDLAQRALEIRLRVFGPDHDDVATSWNHLAHLQELLGNPRAALSLYEQALRTREKALGPDHPDTARLLHNLASVRQALGEMETAEALYVQAQEILERSLGRRHPTNLGVLANLATLRRARGDLPAALELEEEVQSGLEAQLGPDHPDTLRAQTHLARTLRDTGRVTEARQWLDRALPAALDAPDVLVRTWVLAGAADQAAAEGQLPLSVLWGKLALRQVEGLRSQAGRVAQGTEPRAFLASYEVIYRSLADRLVAIGRLPEAESVLELLKKEEQRRFLARDATPTEGVPTVPLTEREQEWLTRFDSVRDTVVVDAVEFQALRKAAARGSLPPDRQARLEELTRRRESAAATVRLALQDLREDLSEVGREATWARLALERSERVQRELKGLPSGTVLLHALVVEDHLTLLLTTPDAQVAEQVPVGAKEVHQAIADLRESLTDPGTDPRGSARILYDWLIRPLEEDLAQAGAQTLLAYLDGALRYVPLAALHDGDRFLVERWATSVYTPAAEADLPQERAEDPWVAAFGATQGGLVGDLVFPGLPSVRGELDRVVRTGEGDSGAAPGRIFLDQSFTAPALSDALHLGAPWLHLASHFHFAPGGTEEDSFLLLGDGSTLTVGDLRRGDFPFTEVEMVALSACETAMGSDQADGSEVEGLAVVAQDRGARAVLASLWPVSDSSTAAWMGALYEQRTGSKASLAESVRRVQLGFLEGLERQEASELPADPHEVEILAAEPSLPGGWSHPFYWAPFVLYGTGR